jgi:hypothetical protein
LFAFDNKNKMTATMENKQYATISEGTRLAISYSFLLALIFVCIFLIAKIFNLEAVTELRALNYVFMFPVTYVMLKKYYVAHEYKIDYFKGFALALVTCVLGQLWFSLTFYFYLKIDQGFLHRLVENLPNKVLYPELSLAFITLSEGIAISVIVALALMQYFKRKRGRWAR